VGSVGDSYDNALAETVNGLYKTEVSSGVGGRGGTSKRSSSPHLSGWTGSTGGGCSSPSGTSRRRSSRQRTIEVRRPQPWWLDSSNRVSGEPGTVHSALALHRGCFIGVFRSGPFWTPSEIGFTLRGLATVTWCPSFSARAGGGGQTGRDELRRVLQPPLGEFRPLARRGFALHWRSTLLVETCSEICPPSRSPTVARSCSVLRCRGGKSLRSPSSPHQG
jgi:hypothetical protein